MKTFVKITMILLVAIAFTGCSNEQSLQKYLVDKQSDSQFIKIDLPTSLILTDDIELSVDQLEVLETIKKINIVAFPIKGESLESFNLEKDKIINLLAQEKYQTLLRFGSNKTSASLKYVGEEDAIDELIVFVADEERGFAIFRLLGNDMDPEKMIKLMKSVEQGDLDLQQFQGIGGLFGDVNDDDDWDEDENQNEENDEINEEENNQIIID